MTCPHPFHDDPPRGERYEFDAGGIAVAAYRCPECESETTRPLRFTLAEKACSRCGSDFEGTAEIADETCTECFMAQLWQLVAEDRARRIRVTRMHTAYRRRTR